MFRRTLSWSLPPRKTQSLVLTFSDPHPLVGSFSHWVLYDLPSGTRQLAEAIPEEKRLPSGARQGQNDVGHIGYYGPCPFFGSRGRYIFRLYALDVVLDLPPCATQGEVEAAMRGHIRPTGPLRRSTAAQQKIGADAQPRSFLQKVWLCCTLIECVIISNRP